MNKLSDSASVFILSRYLLVEFFLATDSLSLVCRYTCGTCTGMHWTDLVRWGYVCTGRTWLDADFTLVQALACTRAIASTALAI